MTTPTAPPSIRAYACLALSMSLVGSYVALSKPLASVFPVFLLAWLRFGIGALAMPHWLRKPPHEQALPKSSRHLLFLQSFLGNFLFTLCMLYGVHLTNATTASVTMAAIPAAIACMGWFFLHERVAPRTWWAILLAVGGIGLFSLSKQELAALDGTAREPYFSLNSHTLGQLLLLAAVVCEAAYTVIGKKLTSTLGPRRITALINVWGLALSTPLGLYSAWHFGFADVAAPTWALLLFYALAACVWSVWLWMTGIATIPATQGAVFTVFLPISAALVGVLVLGERLLALQWAALGLALASVLLATLPTRRQAARAPQ